RLEYGLEFHGDNRENNRYTRAASELKRMIDEKVLVRDDCPCFYIYEQIFEHNGKKLSLKGIIGIVELSEFSEKKVLPHEETLSKAKTDRFELMKATCSNFSQIYSLYNDEEKTLPRLINQLSEREADVSFTAFDGLGQKLWIVSDENKLDEITRLFENKQLFIADGHHRYETALNYKKYMEDAGADGDLWKYCMMFLVDMDDPGLVVYPTHRIVRGIEGFSPEKLLLSAAENFDIFEIDKSAAEKALSDNSDKNSFIIYYDGGCRLLTLKDSQAMKEALPDKGPEYRGLDVSVLHTLILEKLLKIDKENMARQINLTYTRSIDEAFSAVDDGKANCVFFLNATKVSQIKDVSLVNEKMPQKSTYFYPKLITGIVMNMLK
ncbi:MAG: DUF1015 domain-containing protein, partial [Clostridia bacterium]